MTQANDLFDVSGKTALVTLIDLSVSLVGVLVALPAVLVIAAVGCAHVAIESAVCT